MDKRGKRHQSGAASKGSQPAKERKVDERFKEIASNAKFARKPKHFAKVKVDSRFQHMFEDTDFDENTGKVDKYGRKIDKKNRKHGNQLKQYYKVDDSGKKKGDEGDKSSRLDYLNKLARGEIELESSSDEDNSSDEEEDELELPRKSSKTEKTKRKEAERIEAKENEAIDGDASKRVAIQNLDWSKLTAQDIFVAIRSFLPVGGSIESVTVYTSMFGEEQMKKEESLGPQLNETKDKLKESDMQQVSDEADDDAVLLGMDATLEEEEFDREVLREYERNKLKYYFAVVVFDSIDTGNHVYTQCDGVEFEGSSITFDLSFVPDEMKLDRPVRDLATSASDDYEAPQFVTKALQSTNVECTWDEDDYNRQKVMSWKEKAEQKGAKLIEEQDLEAFIASDDDSDSDDSDNETKKSRSREALRAALLGEEDDGDDEEVEEVDEKVVTFFAGGEQKDKNQTKKKTSVMVESKHNKKDLFNDPFFASGDGSEKSKKRGKKNKIKGAEGSKEKEEDAINKEKAELELLLLNEKRRKDGPGLEGFDFNAIVAGEKLLKNKKKIRKSRGKKRENQENVLEVVKNDKFEVDKADSRFNKFYDDPEFSVDRTHSHYKDTKNMRVLEGEQLKRRGEIKKSRKQNYKRNGGTDITSVVKRIKK